MLDSSRSSICLKDIGIFRSPNWCGISPLSSHPFLGFCSSLVFQWEWLILAPSYVKLLRICCMICLELISTVMTFSFMDLRKPELTEQTPVPDLRKLISVWTRTRFWLERRHFQCSDWFYPALLMVWWSLLIPRRWKRFRKLLFKQMSPEWNLYSEPEHWHTFLSSVIFH